MIFRKIATVILTHDNVPLTIDTAESVETYVGDRVLVLVDKAGWDKFKRTKISNAVVIEGFYHNYHKSPYRNCVLGLNLLLDMWPDSDWFLYSECDCLFTSDVFKKDLEKAQTQKAWCLGFDLRKFPFKTSLLEDILLQGEIEKSYYFLGCCQFYHRDFVSKLGELNFFKKFLLATEKFDKGHFPGYERYAFEEELFPTLAAHLGGNLYELSCWKGDERREYQSIKNDPKVLYAGKEHEVWRGHYKIYPVRNSPEIDRLDIRSETSITHPVKKYDDPIRLMYKEKRKTLRKKQFMLF